MRSSSVRRSASLPIVVGLAAVATLLAVGLTLIQITTYDTWGAFFLAPLLVVITLPALARQADRDGDRVVFLILAAALIAKLVGAVVRHYVAFDVYGGAADAARYHNAGIELAERFRQWDFSQVPPLRGTFFIEFITGVIYSVTRASRLGGFVVFSWLGFWGLFLFYRAFSIAMPAKRRRTYAFWLFFLPSLVFWPSSIGKEAWMVFALGLAAFGGARLLTGQVSRGLVTASLGLWLASIVRPHTAALMGIAIVVAFSLRRPPKEHGYLAPVLKVALITPLALGAVLLVARTDSFLGGAGLDTEPGVTGIFSQVKERTDIGGSSFGTSVFDRPSQLPVAAATVLFRPFVFEAHNPQAFAAAAEGTLLILLTLLRTRTLLQGVRKAMRQPYIAFAVVYVGAFIIAFSSIANFGILVRQRAQLLPVYLILMAMPTTKVGADPDALSS